VSQRVRIVKGEIEMTTLLLCKKIGYSLFSAALCLLFTASCATMGGKDKSHCSSRAVELNVWKYIKKGLIDEGFKPGDFDVSFKNCDPLYDRGCRCDVSLSGKICSDSELELLMRIFNNIEGFEVKDVDIKDVTTVSSQEITFHKSDELTYLVNRSGSLTEGATLYMGAFQTPAGRFDVYVHRVEDAIIPDIRYHDLTLDAMKVEKPGRPCFQYLTTLPLKELVPSLYQSDILIEGFQNEDSIYLLYGTKWFLLGTWHMKEETGHQLPSHLSGGSLSLPRKY
jgi:hypothetical protein